MKRTEATVYVAFWMSIAAVLIFGVRACVEDDNQRNVIAQQQWMAQRDDCNKRGGMLVPGWGADWKCEGLK